MVFGISLRPITADSPKISPVESFRSRAPEALVHFFKFFMKTPSSSSVSGIAVLLVPFFVRLDLTETADRTSAPFGFLSHFINDALTDGLAVKVCPQARGLIPGASTITALPVNNINAEFKYAPARTISWSFS